MMDPALIKILTDLQKQLAILEEREANIKVDLGNLRTEINTLRTELQEMKEMADRWKGGFLVLAAIGGVVGWLFSSWSTIASLFKG